MTSPLRLLFLAKRHPQQRDLIERPYGRFYHLPVALAARGHEVTVLLTSQRRLPSVRVEAHGVAWLSEDVLVRGPAGLWRRLSEEASVNRPDWIIGCSDAWYGWLAHRLARRTGARLAIDAYDNFEAYMPWNLALHVAWRRAVRAADVVTAAGPQLAERLDRHRPGRRPTDIVPMAADPAFFPHDRLASRAALELPAEAHLVGYSGGWAHNRDTDILLDAFRIVRLECPNARLVLTGRPPGHAIAIDGVLPLGYVEDAQLPLVLSGLDAACVVTADTAFGRYSYPAKLCEAMACEVPVVATATEPVRWMLHNDARFLPPPGDAHAFAQCILRQLSGARRIAYPALPTWRAGALELESALATSG